MIAMNIANNLKNLKEKWKTNKFLGCEKSCPYFITTNQTKRLTIKQNKCII